VGLRQVHRRELVHQSSEVLQAPGRSNDRAKGEEERDAGEDEADPEERLPEGRDER